MSTLKVSERRVLFNGREIVYTLEKKHVKNLNLRIRENGVFLSASPRVSMAEADAFVRSKGDFILNAQRKIASCTAEKAPPRRFEAGEIFYLFGEPLRLAPEKGSPCLVCRREDRLIVRVPDPGSGAAVQKALQKYFADTALEEFLKIAAEIYPAFRLRGKAMPVLRVRRMVSQWGSCFSLRGVITLNTRLLAYPRPCAEYVAMHEFCHLIHNNHSDRFYALMTELMPDWKERKHLLEQVQRLQDTIV